MATDDEIELWDLTLPDAAGSGRRLPPPPTVDVATLSFDSSERYLLAGGNEGSILVWNRADEQPTFQTMVQTIHHNASPVTLLKPDPQGERVFARDTAGRARI